MARAIRVRILGCFRQGDRRLAERVFPPGSRPHVGVAEPQFVVDERAGARAFDPQHRGHDGGVAPDANGLRAGFLFLMFVDRCLVARVFQQIRFREGLSAAGDQHEVVGQDAVHGGRVVALDVSKEFTDKARGYWREAGVEGKIDLRLGPALDTLDAMIAADEGPFDFAFIDADKPNYDGYYERALKLMRVGGLIALDNMLWSGSVADENDQRDDPRALRALNAKIHADDRVDMVLAALGDGIMLARKR